MVQIIYQALNIIATCCIILRLLIGGGTQTPYRRCCSYHPVMIVTTTVLPLSIPLFHALSFVQKLHTRRNGYQYQLKLWGNSIPSHQRPFWNISRGGTMKEGTDDIHRNDEGDDMMENVSIHHIKHRKAFVIMDGFCAYHSGYIKERIQELFADDDILILPVLSDYLYQYIQYQNEQSSNTKNLFPLHEYPPCPDTTEDVVQWLNQCLSSSSFTENDIPQFIGVYCESDSGLQNAEQLRQLLNISCVDIPIIHTARRNKDEMHFIIANTTKNVNIPQQKRCSSKQEIYDFIQSLYKTDASSVSSLLQKFGIVIKPIRGVASESVALCHTIEQVSDAWDNITSSQIFGSAEYHTNVLVQEYINGTEYAIDVVSRNGSHKVVAVWRYDKRSTMYAPFCYYRTELVDETMMARNDGHPDIELFENICSCVTSSLDALGVKYGISHSEVIIPYESNSKRPYLIEVNCRQHNMNFLPLVNACIGYNALDVTIAAYLGDDETWDVIPNYPKLRRYGSMVHLVNTAISGILQYNEHLQDMVDLESVYDCEVYEKFCTPGSYISPTIDIKTDAGYAQLIDDSLEIVENDYQQIVDWMPTMFQTSNGANEQ